MPNLPGSPIRVDLHILALLSRLHAQSLEQEESIDLNVVSAIKTQFARDPNGAFLSLDALMLDKFIALEEDKCQFMYNLLLSSGGTIVVEAGTSFGVSTIYLSLAVGQNVATQKASGDQHATGRVIGTEKEPSKADIARAYWAEAGEQVEQYIDLKVGDLNDTLAGDLGLEGRKVDFLLLDIWPHVALPALNRVLPHLRSGAVVLTDNITQSAAQYGDLLKVLRNPNGPFRSTTLPYKGGLELSVYVP